MPIYVNMVDKFMSGWGRAENGLSKLSVRCDTHEEADAIERAARDRKEMRYVTISSRHARVRAGDMLSIRHVSEMKGPWRQYMKTP